MICIVLLLNWLDSTWPRAFGFWGDFWIQEAPSQSLLASFSYSQSSSSSRSSSRSKAVCKMLDSLTMSIPVRCGPGSWFLVVEVSGAALECTSKERLQAAIKPRRRLASSVVGEFLGLVGGIILFGFWCKVCSWGCFGLFGCFTFASFGFCEDRKQQMVNASKLYSIQLMADRKDSRSRSINPARQGRSGTNIREYESSNSIPYKITEFQYLQKNMQVPVLLYGSRISIQKGPLYPDDPCFGSLCQKPEGFLSFVRWAT